MLRQNECRSLVTIVLKRQTGQKNKKANTQKNKIKKKQQRLEEDWQSDKENSRGCHGSLTGDMQVSAGSQVTGFGRRVQGHPVGGWRGVEVGWRGEMFRTNSVQTGIILAERTPTQKVPTSLHWIFICIKSLIYIHAVSALGFSITHSLSPSIPPCPSSLSLFILLHLPSFQSAFHVTPLGGVQREGWWLLSPASLLWFCCSCWAVIKRAKRRSFHTNYNIIMEHSVKATVKMKVKQSFV